MDEKKLFEEVKNYLDITFDDTEYDRKLTGIIARGSGYLSNIAGVDLDFEKGHEKQLLFDYCRYAAANNIEDFRHNFSSDLIMLRAGKEADFYAGPEEI